MKSGMKTLTAIAVLLAATVLGVQGDDDSDGGKSFFGLAEGYTQQLWGVTDSYALAGGYLGGVAVLQTGEVLSSECGRNRTALHSFSIVADERENSTDLHSDTRRPSSGTVTGGCGMVLHPDGTLYLNMDDGTNGVANLDPATGAFIRKFGPRGNALGIAVDPQTLHLVYTGRDCAAGIFGPTCTLYDIAPGASTATSLKVFKPDESSYIDGLYFDPSGDFLFLDNRLPLQRLTVISRTGAIKRHIELDAEPIGIGFHAATPRFVVTNNQDGTLTRFDFPNDDYTKSPDVSLFAYGGYRGDLMQVGPDGCLYLTQGGARYDNNNEEPAPVNSIVRLCGGFAPPPGIVVTDTLAPTTTASLSPLPNANGWNRTKVDVSLQAIDDQLGSGVKQVSYSVSGAQTVAQTTVPGDEASFSISAEGESTITYFSTDNVGNVESTQSVTVRIDKTHPSITSTRLPGPNEAGWNNTPVTISFQCSDALSGLTSDSPTGPVTLSTSGENQSVEGTCRDLADNQVSTTVKNINLDFAPPSTTATPSPSPNSDGWNNANVTVNLRARDSGGADVKRITYSIAGAQTVAATTVNGSSAAPKITNEGVSTITFFATDDAGNVEAANTLVLRLDKTPPSISATRTPAPNPNGWNNTSVTVSFACSDALSGLAAGSPPAPTTLSSNGSGQSVTGTCRDRAGNAASATVGDINIATGVPTLTISASTYELWPPNGKNVADVISGLLISPLGIDPNTAVFKVVDSYGEIQPSGKIKLKADGGYEFTVNLSSKRSGTDKSGRVYTITVSGSDYAGNKVSGSIVVRVPHDQGKGK